MRSSPTSTSSPRRPLPRNEPAISVDTKKRSSSATSGTAAKSINPRVSRKGPRPRLQDPELGRASPYGVYDIGDNKGWVSVGMDHDTGSFAVNAIPPVVGNHGQASLSENQDLADQRRWRRQAMEQAQALEV